MSQDNMLRCLTVVVIFHPAVGDLGVDPATGTANYLTYYQVQATSFGEYETA